VPPPLPRRRRIAFWLVLVLVQLVAYEIVARVLLYTAYDSHLWPGDGIPGRFYPELRAVQGETRGDRIDVLLLGASVLDQATPELRRQAAARFGPEVCLHDLAVSGHTSLDSWYKYRHLRDDHFDLVVVYHAINELRTNNTPPERFHDDYSHYSWYALINLFERRDGWQRSGLFVALNLGLIKAEMALGLRDFTPRHVPMEATMHHGETIRSAGPFRRNLEHILDLAEARGEPVLLLSFASYVPLDYTHERFLERQLDYAGYEVPIRLWGLEENVVRGLGVHNRVLRALAETREVRFLDLAAAMPAQGDHYLDICHFSRKGEERFASLVLDEIGELRGGIH